MIINFNDLVRVKLTDHGVQILRQQHDAIFQGLPGMREFVPPAADDAGWTSMQLWDLMECFGPHVGMCKPLPFALELEVPPWTEVKK